MKKKIISMMLFMLTASYFSFANQFIKCQPFRYLAEKCEENSKKENGDHHH